MKFSLTPCAALILLPAAVLRAAPVEIARESFDGGGFGFTTSVAQFDEPTVATSDYFSVQPNNGTKRNGGVIPGGDGANMFAAEDIDTNPGPLVAAQQSITFNAVNIAGKTTVTARLLIAAPGTGTSQTFYDHDAGGVATDFIRVEASVDGGPYTRLAQYSPSTATLNQSLSLDLDANGVGGDGPALGAGFQEFIYPVSNGNNVQLRVVMHSNATSEYLCVDNVRIFADTPATSPPSLGGVLGTTLTYTEGSPATAVAPAITVTDPDSANLTSATVTISSGYVNGEDLLSATPSGSIVAGDIVFSPATGVLTITRTATKANYETVLRSVSFRNTNATAPVTGNRGVQFRVTDGTNFSNQPIRTVDVVDNITTHGLPFTESFETDGRGSRYALDGRFTNGTAFFDRRSSLAGVTGADGTFYIAGEDTDLNPAPVEAVRFSLNTAGFSLLTASLRVAAPGGAVYDSGDAIVLETSADGGAWTPVAEFRSTGAINSVMALDTNLDGSGDGAALSGAMQTFDFLLPAATTLGLRVRLISNSTAELIAVDRIAVSGTVDGPFIPVLGTMAHSENFNTLPTADGAWADSVVRKGWYAQINNGTTPPGIFQASDGTAPLTALINCGATGSPDRALGSKATSTGGFANIAYAAVFKNISALPVKFTRLRYAQEFWRSGAATAEKVTTFYAVSNAPLVSIQSGTSNATAAAGAGFTALPPGANASVSSAIADVALDGNLAGNRSLVDFALVAGSEPVVQPGQYLTIKWTDTNEAGNDGHQAIDDVTVDFVQLDCSIQLTVGNVLRKPGANPADPADDVVDITLTVTGVGNVSPLGWRTTSGHFGGNQLPYGTYNFVDAPLAQFTPVFTQVFEDAANPSCQGTAIVGLPAALGLTAINGSPAYIQASDAPGFLRQTGPTEITVDPGAGVLLTDAFSVPTGSEKCLAITIEAQDLSTGSGLDVDDTIKVELLTNSPQAPTQVLGSEFDLNTDGLIGGGTTPETDEFNTESLAAAVKWTTGLTFSGIIPANATSLQVRVTVVLNNTSVPVSEVFRIRNIGVVPCVDSDGDRVIDTVEGIHGTNPMDAASYFRLNSVSSVSGSMSTSFTTAAGRMYQPVFSDTLVQWGRDGLPIAGDGSVKTHATATSLVTRRFLRYIVSPPQTIQP